MSKMFFDRQLVIDAIGRVRAAALAKMGAFVRRSAKSSIRKRKRISDPGSPPSSHTDLLKQFIFFGYDTTAASVVIGPEKLNQQTDYSPDRGTIPAALELGGTVVVRTRNRRRDRNLVVKRVVKIKARPYMRPALEANMSKFPQLFGDASPYFGIGPQVAGEKAVA